MKYILWNILWRLRSMSNSALYNCTKQVDLQWSFRAEHRTLLGNLVPMIDDEVKSTMKDLWSPMPPLCGRMFALMHSILAVAKTASMGIVPSLNVGGIWMRVHWRHCLLNIKSDCDRHLEMRPEYTFSLKSPSRTILEWVCFHTINWAINCSKNIVQAERKLPRASKYLRVAPLLLRPNTLHYLRLWGRLCLCLIWWRKSMWFSLFTYHCQGLLSRSEKIISHVLQWQTIPSSLHVQDILQSNIITFASMSLGIPIRIILPRLTIAQQMIKLQIFLQNLFAMIFSFS